MDLAHLQVQPILYCQLISDNFTHIPVKISDKITPIPVKISDNFHHRVA
jgi:hypothetical protein